MTAVGIGIVAGYKHPHPHAHPRDSFTSVLMKLELYAQLARWIMKRQMLLHGITLFSFNFLFALQICTLPAASANCSHE